MKSQAKPEVFILTTEPLEGPGGMERFLSYLSGGFRDRGFEVRVFHRENCAPARWRRLNAAKKLEWFLGGILQGYFVVRAAKKALHPGLRFVVSNSTVGWLPLGHRIRQAHLYHGTYRGQAESIRPFIRWLGYLKLKWWDAMVLEKLSGRGKLRLCNSDQTREELQRFFRYDGHTVWCPLDTQHFRPTDRNACRRALGLRENQPVGVFVGSAHPQKGFPIVRSLIGAFPHVQWLLALRGEVPADLSGMGSVRVYKDAPYEQLPLLYNAADFSLCPSRYEPFGYVVAEALACGTPVVATPGGASRLFLKEPLLDRLLIEDPDAVSRFQEATSGILRSPETYRQAVLQQVRPRLEEIMGSENWWRRLFGIAGI